MNECKGYMQQIRVLVMCEEMRIAYTTGLRYVKLKIVDSMKIKGKYFIIRNAKYQNVLKQRVFLKETTRKERLKLKRVKKNKAKYRAKIEKRRRDGYLSVREISKKHKIPINSVYDIINRDTEKFDIAKSGIMAIKTSDYYRMRILVYLIDHNYYKMIDKLETKEVDKYKHIDTKQAAKLKCVSERVIIRWIKQGIVRSLPAKIDGKISTLVVADERFDAIQIV